jgi:hypothetical protein
MAKATGSRRPSISGISDMRYGRIRFRVWGFLTILLLSAPMSAADESTRVTDEASAVAAAKRYTKAQCTDTPCHYRARREGKQWNVWVDFTRRDRPGAKPQTYHGGHVILYFNEAGQLVRRIKGE